jgi:hypothetical protein
MLLEQQQWIIGSKQFNRKNKMKLWQVVQWGNKEEGADGWDTQCVVAASDMMSAITKAELHFSQYYSNYREGKADMILLLADNALTDSQESVLIIPIWIKPSYNLGKSPSWHRRNETNEWLSHKDMYGED